MKKIILFALLSVIGSSGFSQFKTPDIFTKNDLVWYGLDFSKAKFIGKFEQAKGFRPANSFDIINKYIPAWNELIVMEPGNFNLGTTFRKRNIYYDLKAVETLNKTISQDDLITINSHFITAEELQTMISNYPQGDKKDGLGLVFIVESFNKPQSNASVWIVFFDIATKKILLSDYCKGEPSGFGLRNYWAGAFKHILRDVHSHKYDNWKKLYSRSAVSNATVLK